VTFNPQRAQQYERKLPLYVDKEMGVPYLEYLLRGRGTTPQLAYNKKEIIIPAAPLDLLSKAEFRVTNNGYENLDLSKYRVKLMDYPQDAPPVTLGYPENARAVNISRTNLRIEAIFRSKKPINMTGILEFQGDLINQPDPIHVSAVADNCTLTAFSFLLRNRDQVAFEAREGIVRLRRVTDDSDDEAPALPPTGANANANAAAAKPKPSGRAHSKAGSTLSRTSRKITLLGYMPILPQYRKKACDYIKRWLNTNALGTSIQYYPQDVVRDHGKQIYELIQFLSGKNLQPSVPPAPGVPGAAPGSPTRTGPSASAVPGIAPTAIQNQNQNLNANSNPNASASANVNASGRGTGANANANANAGANAGAGAGQPGGENGGTGQSAKEEGSEEVNRRRYEQLLTKLTEFGAMLNTLRPEHLLTEDEYRRYCKRYKSLAGDAANRYPHVSEEAWITLFYQILKIFYLRRVTYSDYRSLSSIPATEKRLPPSNSSNIYSDSEVVLLRWLEFHFNQQNPTENRTLKDFESDLQDSLVFAAVIKAYCRNVKGLGGLQSVVKTSEQRKANATKIITVLKDELKLRTHITEEDILEPSTPDMVLFCTQLYLYLRYYLPCDTIEFPCQLSRNCTREIELTNNNNVRISYFVQLEGSRDFTVEDTRYVSIDPGTVKKFPVTFVSRISKPVEAMLMFNNHSDGPKQAAPLVFKLVSKVTSRVSTATFSEGTDSNLYEPKEVQIEVKNNFEKNARFSLELKYEKRKAAEPTAGAGPQKKKKATRGAEPAEELTKYVPEPFYTRVDTLNVAKGASQSLVVTFLPFELGPHKCYVILIDNDVGEIQYEIHANARLPSPQSEPLQKTFPAESRQTIDIPVQFRNIKLDTARTTLLSQCVKSRQEREKQNWEKYKAEIKDQQQFDVKIVTDSPGVFQCPNSIVVMDKSAAKRDNPKLDASRVPSDMMSDKGDDNRLQLVFTAKVVKRYEAKVMISNQAKTDVRIFDLAIKTHPPPVFGQLTFNVPARHNVVQDIPINNESDKDWTIKVELQYDRGQPARFDVGRSDFSAPRKQVTNIPLKFAPDWVCECKGKLTITILSTNQTFVYELLGKGEEPLAEDKIVVNCEAKKTTRYQLAIKNESDRSVQYKVETDMSKVLAGDPQLKVAPRETAKYTLNITPLVGGIDMGSITFMDGEQYIWYVVELHVRSPEAEQERSIATTVRQPRALEFAIRNPLNEPVTFDVEVRGEGLIGESSLGVPANQTKIYELVYAPLKAGEAQGYVTFVSEKAGEIKCKLQLKADEASAQPLPFMEVELGRNDLRHAVLENPTKEGQLVLSHNSNPTNFEVPDKVEIPPYSSIQVPIKYTPSNLDTTETARIVFESKNIGRWEFVLEGRGKFPTEMKPERVTTTIGDTVPASITFKNPLKEQAIIEVTIEPSDVPPSLIFCIGEGVRPAQKQAEDRPCFPHLLPHQIPIHPQIHDRRQSHHRRHHEQVGTPSSSPPARLALPSRGGRGTHCPRGSVLFEVSIAEEKSGDAENRASGPARTEGRRHVPSQRGAQGTSACRSDRPVCGHRVGQVYAR
jgi:hypothetical protein